MNCRSVGQPPGRDERRTMLEQSSDGLWRSCSSARITPNDTATDTTKRLAIRATRHLSSCPMRSLPVQRPTIVGGFLLRRGGGPLSIAGRQLARVEPSRFCSCGHTNFTGRGTFGDRRRLLSIESPRFTSLASRLAGDIHASLFPTRPWPGMPLSVPWRGRTDTIAPSIITRLIHTDLCPRATNSRPTRPIRSRWCCFGSPIRTSLASA